MIAAQGAQATAFCGLGSSYKTNAVLLKCGADAAIRDWKGNLWQAVLIVRMGGAECATGGAHACEYSIIMATVHICPDFCSYSTGRPALDSRLNVVRQSG